MCIRDSAGGVKLDGDPGNCQGDPCQQPPEGIFQPQQGEEARPRAEPAADAGGEDEGGPQQFEGEGPRQQPGGTAGQGPGPGDGDQGVDADKGGQKTCLLYTSRCV